MSAKKLPLLMRRRGSMLIPIDPLAEEQLRALPEGQDFNVVATYAGKESPRRGAQRWYWAGLGLMAAATELWPTSRKLHELILENLDYTTKRWRIDRTYEVVPDSIAYDNMTDEEFLDFFERARAWVLTEFGTDPWEEWKAQKEANRWASN